MKKKIFIEGMSCNNCVGHVKDALSELKNAKDIEVDLQNKYAIVDCDATIEEIKDVIEEQGYDVISIE